MSTPPTTGELLARRTEFHELAEGLSLSEQAGLRAEALADPYFEPGIRSEDLLRGLAVGIGSLVEQPPAKSPGTEQARNDAVDQWAALADIETEERQAQRAAEKKLTISQTHNFVQEYTDTRRGMGKSPSAKQRKALQRSLRRGYRERWKTDELADNPEQLRTILESIDAMEGSSTETKETLSIFIADQVKDHIKQTWPETDPDVMGRRLKTALEPSLVGDRLIDSLLRTYFESAQGRQSAEVLDNYECFVRGILRCADSPAVMARAIQIAQFETDIVEQDSLYFLKAQILPQFRLDQPELFGQRGGINKALAQIKMYLDDLSILGEKSTQVNLHEAALEEMTRLQDAGASDIREAVKQLKTTRFGVLFQHEGMRVVEQLGEDGYKRRLEAMSLFQELSRDGSIATSFMQDFLEMSMSDKPSPSHAIDMLIHRVAKQHPDCEDFLRAMFNTPSVVQDELPRFIQDPTGEITKLIRTAAGQKLLAEAVGGVEQLENLAGISIEDMMAGLEEMAQEAHTISIPLEDGFVLDWIVAGSNHYPSAEELALVLDAIGTEQLEAAKQQLRNTTGAARRRHELLMAEDDSGVQGIIRFENEEDRKTWHLVDSITGTTDLEFDTSIAALQQEIEGTRNTILQQRRRFLSDRGIEAVLEEADERLSIQIHKHPRNPQAFVVTVEGQDAQGIHTARILMDSSLAFQLGNKKVRSPENLLVLNAMAAELLAIFTCQEAVETTEGTIKEGSNLVARIAHLRLLPEGQKSSFTQWEKCLDQEGLDLDVLNKQQQQKLNTKRSTTYVQAVEDDDTSKGPIRILLP